MNKILKKIFLTYKTKYNIKNRSLQQSTAFEDSVKIAILYADPDDHEIQQLVSALEQHGKEVSTLRFYSSTKNIRVFSPYITIKDISLYGNVEKREASRFFEQNYDFAICIDESNHYIVNYIISLLQARCRIGVMHPDRKNLFEMMVIADKKESDLCGEVMKYLKMIKTYEH